MNKEKIGECINPSEKRQTQLNEVQSKEINKFKRNDNNNIKQDYGCTRDCKFN